MSNEDVTATVQDQTLVLSTGQSYDLNGDVDLRETNVKTFLTDALNVVGSLNVEGCPIEEFPAIVNVGQTLDGRGTKVLKLSNVTTGGSLDFEDTGLVEFGPGMHIGWALLIKGTKVTEIPIDMIVDGEISKDF